jgi:hypothetical protein
MYIGISNYRMLYWYSLISKSLISQLFSLTFSVFIIATLCVFLFLVVISESNRMECAYPILYRTRKLCLFPAFCLSHFFLHYPFLLFPILSSPLISSPLLSSLPLPSPPLLSSPLLSSLLLPSPPFPSPPLFYFLLPLLFFFFPVLLPSFPFSFSFF